MVGAPPRLVREGFAAYRWFNNRFRCAFALHPSSRGRDLEIVLSDL